MSDRKKIITGVHDARRYLEDREWVDKSVGVHIDALNDALVLLKEQEPIKPLITGHGEYEEEGSWWYECGKCGTPIDPSDNFCRKCGKAAKWDAAD